MLRVLLSAAVLLCTSTALADRKLLVPRADSNVDWGTRKRVEGAVISLARHVDRGASSTDAPFGELASGTGCKGPIAKCKDAVIAALDVDELVVISIASAGGGRVRVTVRRAPKGGGVREASALVPADDPDQGLRKAIGPLFGASGKSPPPPPPPRSSPPPPPPAVVTSRPPPRPAASSPSAPPPESDVTASSAEPRPEPEPAAEPTPAPAAPVAPAADPATDETVTAAPDNTVRDTPGRSSRLPYIGGVAAGGALTIVGIVLWNAASGVQDDLDDAPTRTSEDIEHILDLEDKGDAYALWGNVTFFAGLAVAGASGYLWWRAERRDRAQARITPLVVDGGAGVVLTIGGWP